MSQANGTGRLLGRADLMPTFEDVPHEGGYVRVRRMSVAERIEYHRAIREAPEAEKRRISTLGLLARCLVNADGSLMYGPDELDAVGEMDGLLGELCFDAAQRINYLAAKQEEDAEKN